MLPHVNYPLINDVGFILPGNNLLVISSRGGFSIWVRSKPFLKISSYKLMRLASTSVVRLNNWLMIFLTLLLTTIIIIGNPLKLKAQSGIDFYLPSSPPAGMKTFEPLIAKWWDFRGNQPSRIGNTWPMCLKADVTVDNRSIVFLGDPASAPAGGANLNATHQACQISSSQLLYLSVYDGECSQGDSPGKSIPQLLTCAQDSNKIMKLMQVKVDSTDVSSNIVRETTSNPWILTIPSSDNAFSEKLPCCGEAMAENYF
ncbi:MAG TPA: hypothetical protein VEH06_14645, partial [Candidatus Bathyarchaeia archaeon]|nr:hypothetical protein [Candidatus Bathyarchaeia archaeon]